MNDIVHTTVAVISLALISGGLYSLWGAGAAALVLGLLLLMSVIYARVR